MDTAFRYWQLVRLDGSGHCYAQVMPRVCAWLQANFGDQPADPVTSDRQLQAALLAIYSAQKADSDLAQISLRCYISHQIRTVCVQLANQFGGTYGFTARDLFPLVLDDVGQSASSHYRPLSLSILDAYDPAKARLNTWVSRLVKNHAELNRALLERGLYRASDWAILNDTTPEQVQRILQHYHQCSDAEITTAVQLLTRYQAVYLAARLKQRQAGKPGRCQPPTPEQLQQINPQLPAKEVLGQLKALAAQLRQYRIHARGGNPIPYGGDSIDWDRHLDRQPGPAADAEDEQAAFLEAFRQALSDCLDGGLAEAIRANMARLQKRNPPRDQDYVRGLQLFHCEGLSMTQIAPKLGLTTQVQVTRLLQLRRLQADVRLLLIPRLLEWMQTDALDYISADRLKQIDQTLEHLLTDMIDRLIDEAVSEAKTPHDRVAKSLFTRQLCQTIHQFRIGQE